MLDAVRTGRLHHAWLITGPAGIGKTTLAFRFARRLLAGPDADLHMASDHPVFRRVAAGTHADLLTIERGYDEKRKRPRTETVVDDVRDLNDFLRLTPAEGGWRIAVVDGAEHMNRNAANALLKLLEEPPRRALLLLSCAAPGRLLPTIRSRCRQLMLMPLTEPAMRDALRMVLPDRDAADHARLAGLAEGSPGRALLLADGNGLQLAGLVDDVLAAFPQGDAAGAYQLADTLARSDDGFTVFMTLLRTAIASLVRQAARGSEQGGRLLQLRPLEAWGSLWQALTRLQDETERFNLDKRQAIVSGIARLNQL